MLTAGVPVGGVALQAPAPGVARAPAAAAAATTLMRDDLVPFVRQPLLCIVDCSYPHFLHVGPRLAAPYGTDAVCWAAPSDHAGLAAVMPWWAAGASLCVTPVDAADANGALRW
jgi:hypothetical protein